VNNPFNPIHSIIISLKIMCLLTGSVCCQCCGFLTNLLHNLSYNNLQDVVIDSLYSPQEAHNK